MRSAMWLVVAVLGIGVPTAAVAQKKTVTIDCSVNGERYTCSQGVLERRFAVAKTVAISADPKSPSVEAQLNRFIESVKKQVAPEGQADLTLHLVKTPTTGVEIGPAEAELATLRVFGARRGQEQHLIWVERYRGRLDMPWNAVVRALLDQFQDTLAGK